MKREIAIELDRKYDTILGQLVALCNAPEHWTIPQKSHSLPV